MMAYLGLDLIHQGLCRRDKDHNARGALRQHLTHDIVRDKGLARGGGSTDEG